jgi:hypothetical protein
MYTNLVRKPERNRPFGRSRHRLEANIKRNLKERVWEDAGWIHIAQDKDQQWALTIMNCQLP